MTMGSATAARKKRVGFSVKLNLVSLMDIFTILVFFLLLNSGDSQHLEKAKFIELPDSSTTNNVHGDLMIVVSEGDIYLGESVLVSVEEVMKAPQDAIEPLADALADYVAKRGELTRYEKAKGLSVTIMGDESVPYVLLKSVMATCNQQNFRDISLAVNRVVGNSFSAPMVSAVGG
jgi:biopolymer transport protein ExbD